MPKVIAAEDDFFVGLQLFIALPASNVFDRLILPDKTLHGLVKIVD